MEEWVGERWHRLIMRVADPYFLLIIERGFKNNTRKSLFNIFLFFLI